MKNILFIELSLNPTNGGVERVSYILSKAFQNNGYENYFLFCDNDSDLIAENHKLRFNTNNNEEYLYKQFCMFIESNQIDIIICQNVFFPKFHSVYRKLKAQYNIKFITCLHSNPDIWINKNKWGYTTKKVYFKELARSIVHLFKNPYKEQINGMYEISDKFVLLSDAFIPIFKELYHTNINDNKLVAVANPCSFTEKENIPHKENIVLVVARMAEQQKRISNILRIWQKVESNYEDWKLVLVGDGPDLGMYKAMFNEMKLKNVKFIGHSNDVAAFYKRSRIFLTTSIWEGLPMTLIEAQYYGCVPIALDNYAALNDIINNGNDGFIVEPQNITQFSNFLSLLMSDHQLCKDMSERAIANVETKFDVHIITKYWLNILNEKCF